MELLVIGAITANSYLKATLEMAAGEQYHLNHAASLQAACPLLKQQHYQAILCVSLPASEQAAFEQLAFEQLPPVIVIVSSVYDPFLITALQLGINDYLIASELEGSHISLQLQSMIEAAQLRRVQPMSTGNLSDIIINRNVDGLLMINQAGVILFANPAAAFILGRTPKQLLNAPFGYPLVVGATTEIDLINSIQGPRIAEMHVAAAIWESQPTYVVTLRDVTEQHQNALRANAAEQFSWAILNSLSTHICVLNEQGVITAVNQAWREFAIANGASDLSLCGVGADYFAICQHAGVSDGIDALAGMRAVLYGERELFELEYPCHSLTEERWFLMRIVPLISEGGRGLVVSHTDITANKLANRLKAEAEALRIQLQQQAEEIQALEALATDVVIPEELATDTPLRIREAARFIELQATYSQMLELALDRRIYKQVPEPLTTPKEFAEQLGALFAMPRDLVEIHLLVIREKSAMVALQRIQAYLDEGRIMVLEVMGHLATFYRSKHWLFHKR